MPYILRNPQGEITSLHREPVPGGEALRADDAELRGFLAGVRAAAPAASDAARAAGPHPAGGSAGDTGRLLDDLIDLLVARNLICVTDLPAEAQRILFARQHPQPGVRATPGRHAADRQAADGTQRPATEPGLVSATLDLGLRADDVLPAPLLKPATRGDTGSDTGSSRAATGGATRAMPVGLRARSPATELDTHTALGTLGMFDSAEGDASVL